MRKPHFGFILLLFLFLVPNMTFAEKASTSGQPKANQPKEWVKIDDGLYQFNFTKDTNEMTEADKSDLFFKELSQFKKDHSDERVIGFQSKVSEDPSHSIIGFTVATEKKEINKAFITAIVTGIITGLIGLLTLWYNLKNNKKTLFVDTITAERVKWMGQLREHVSEFLTLVTYHIEKNKDATQKDKSEYVDNVFRLAAKIKLHLNYLDRKDQKIIKIVDEFTNDIKKIFETASLGDPLEDEVMNKLLEPKQAEIDIETKKRYKNFSKKHKRSLTIADMAKIDKFVIKDYQALVLDEIKREEEALIKRMDTNPQKLLSITQAYLKDEWNRVKEEAESGNISKK
ncbi:hypothetical protein P9H08_09900 [Bacillus cereus]|uniref:hypothetical protein n=1 Tax=Bacillus toyonensis TaxID=155322 RepID=UPI000BF8A901|nr:hypothetical protein [Bacillus toyonensis]MEC2256989.1 hypothetical protein [Bacillus cereus]PEP16076.1 hypothetical protein CN578_14260 [Bacillus toyonensis]